MVGKLQEGIYHASGIDPESFQHSVSKSFTGSERSSSGRSIWHPLAASGAKKWEGARHLNILSRLESLRF